MKTEQLKELYATGEWVCVRKHKIQLGHKATYKDWYICDSIVKSDTTCTYTYKLIHKKHLEVLDHVLNGGEWFMVNTGQGLGREHRDTFFLTYSPKYYYEIIKGES